MTLARLVSEYSDVPKASHIIVRVDDVRKGRIVAAAQASGMTVTAFVLDAALREAERVERAERVRDDGARGPRDAERLFAKLVESAAAGGAVGYDAVGYQLREYLDRHVTAARQAGNQIHTGGGIAHDAGLGDGWFFQPTIISARSAQDPLVQEEIFGPVLTVQTAHDLDEVIALANCTSFALVAGIYSRDLSSAYRFARDVDAGQVYINEYFAGGIEVPFGGNRKSGFGREKGLEGIKSYCKLKSVVAKI